MSSHEELHSAAQQPDGSGDVLAAIRAAGDPTTTELAAMLGVARSTVMQRLELLDEAGLVDRSGLTSGARGRPAARNRFRPDAGVAIAAHLGVSGCRLAAFDLDGVLLGERLVQVRPAGAAASIAEIVERGFAEILDDVDASGRPVVGIGLATPSQEELRRYWQSLGLVEPAWSIADLAASLEETFRARVIADLDVNLMGIAEWSEGWGDTEVVVCVKVGTLIDAGILVRGVPIRGVGGLAGSLGHVKVPGADGACSCGGSGCLDTVASGGAVLARLRARRPEIERVSDVVRLAREGDADVNREIRAAGRAVGEALANVVNLVAPGAIVLWGYLADVDRPFLAGVRETLVHGALPELSDRVVVARSALGDLAGVHGAVARVLEDVLAPDAVDRVLRTRDWRAASA